MLNEGLSSQDKREIRELIQDEVGKYLRKNSNLRPLANDIYKAGEYEKKSIEVTKNGLTQLFKALWSKRDVWTNRITNTSN